MVSLRFTSKLDVIFTAVKHNNRDDHVNKKCQYNNQKLSIGFIKLINIIPHITKVAACINADTGIGPSIASGNQICNPNCVDFEKLHIIINIIINIILKKSIKNIFINENENIGIP